MMVWTRHDRNHWLCRSLHSRQKYSPLPIQIVPRAYHGQAEQFALIHATMDAAVALAEAIGCTRVIEDIYDKHPGPVRALVQSFNSDNVRMSIDVGHAILSTSTAVPRPTYRCAKLATCWHICICKTPTVSLTVIGHPATVTLTGMHSLSR